MDIRHAVALVTGANRGIGRALVRALLEAGADKIYAAARQPDSLRETLALDPQRIIPVRLDVSDPDAVRRLAAEISDLRLLVNNAGVLDFGSALDMPIEAIRRNFEVNFFGTLTTARAFAPVIEGNGGGAIVNVLSVVALASMPGLAGYNASKAALWSITQSLRGNLANRHIAVHSVFPGPVDTDMAAAIDIQKTGPDEVAKAVIEGVQNGVEDIFPDPMARQVYEGWRRDHKAIEKQFAAM
jgi:NAD(P)-dependent dehydrogenase (short-subunit alcohol dehydrogenase family)